MEKNRAEIGHAQGNASYKISRSVLMMILQLFKVVRRLALQAWIGAADLLNASVQVSAAVSGTQNKGVASFRC